jgi:arylsulfatase A-like enzyme
MALTCGMIAMIDDAVGALLDALDETGLAKNTVVVFNTDHGDFLGDHGMLLKGPLHFQGLIRVPFLWADPGRPSAPVVDALSSTIDVAPTILARAGITPFNGIQGRDLAGALAGAEAGREALLIEDDANRAYLGFETAPRLRTLVTRRYRLSVYLDETWGELYDLRADPLEMHNLWDDAGHAATRDGLIRQLLHEVMRADDRSPWPTKTA